MTLFRKKYRVESIRMKNWDYRSSNAYFITICTKYHFKYFGRVSGGSMIFSDVGIIADKNIHEIPIHFPHASLDEFIVMPNHVHLILFMDQNKIPPFGIVEKNITNDLGIMNNFPPQSDLTQIIETGSNRTQIISTALEETQNFASLPMPNQPMPNQPMPNQPMPNQPMPNQPMPNQPMPNQRPSDQKPGQPSTQTPPTIFDAEYRITNFFEYHSNKFGPQSKNLGSIIRGYKSAVKKWATINQIEFQWQPRYYESVIRDEDGLNRIRQYIKSNPGKWLEDQFHNQ